jgi:proteasome lid subunit RPN8/RPN11
MITDSIARRPSESVGLIGGPTPACASVCIPLPNRSWDDKHFWADPFAQWQALQYFKENKLTAVAVYHSHPNGGVTMSEQDRSFARHLGLAQIIVSVREGQVDLAGYLVNGEGAVVNIPLEIG